MIKNNHTIMPFNYLDKSKTIQNITMMEEDNNLLSQYITIESDESDSSITYATAGDTILVDHDHPDPPIVDTEVEEQSFISQMLLEERNNIEQNEIIEDDDDSQFVSCHYQYCHTLVHTPELINGLFCSSECKQLDCKLIEVEESTNNEKINIEKKSVVDKKHILTKLENRINKRKQLLISACPEKIARNKDWNEIKKFDNSCRVDVHQSFRSLPNQISISVAKDGYQDILDLKTLTNDQVLLSYMEEMQYRSAPTKLFAKPFPTEKNPFKVGQKLEGIDPEHEALFCVMTVVQVCGYRIKLQFDGYSDIYNFWVNADCPDIFYAGWCKKNSRILQPPKNYGHEFNWTSYLQFMKALPAPKENFASTKNLMHKTHNPFCVGEKLEAIDMLTRTLPKQIICVATVADILGNRIRIHYDGWTDDYDCWMDITSSNIHPILWCERNGRSLAPPSGYNDLKGKKPFSWPEYLRETNSKPVPENAFVRKPLRDFTNNMKIEVVDVANPSLIRIAEILNIRGDELRILYDGFNEKYAFWIEDDSPDIHPIGWCLKTNHPIEIPSEKLSHWGCRVQGCSGKGNNQNIDNIHYTLARCPYEVDAWKKSVSGLSIKLDRVKNDTILIDTKIISSQSKITDHHEDEKEEMHTVTTDTHSNLPLHEENIILNKSNEQLVVNNTEPEIHFDNINEPDNDEISSDDNIELRNEICMSLILHDIGYASLTERSRAWTRHNAQLGIPLFNTTDPRKWSIEEVANYVGQIVTNNNRYPIANEQNNISNRFIEQVIDGETFLMLTQKELMNIMSLPLGMALKLSSAILMLRQRIPAFDLATTCFSPHIKS